MSKRSPDNTAERAQQDPLGMVMDAMLRGASGSILYQEAQGQSQLVASSVLPSKMDSRTRKALEDAGVKFGELVDGDSLFIYAELPEGWRKEGTDHSMYSDLLDEKGRKRASIFYKAAFYDRSAHMYAILD